MTAFMASYGWHSGDACSFTTSHAVKNQPVEKGEKIFQPQDHCETKSHEDAQTISFKADGGRGKKKKKSKVTFPPSCVVVSCCRCVMDVQDVCNF